MSTVNRDYLKLVLLCLRKQHTVEIVEILTPALEYPNHVGPKSKIVSPCSAKRGELCFTVSDVRGLISHL